MGEEGLERPVYFTLPEQHPTPGPSHRRAGSMSRIPITLTRDPPEQEGAQFGTDVTYADPIDYPNGENPLKYVSNSYIKVKFS